MERLANVARERIQSLLDQSAKARAQVICQVMKENGIIAARDVDYYAIENSFIHLSLQGRGSLPITLAVIFTGVALRCELHTAPINYVHSVSEAL